MGNRQSDIFPKSGFGSIYRYNNTYCRMLRLSSLPYSCFICVHCCFGNNYSHAQVYVKDDALLSLIENYCPEAGIRNLQKHIEKIFRKVSETEFHKFPFCEHSSCITDRLESCNLLSKKFS